MGLLDTLFGNSHPLLQAATQPQPPNGSFGTLTPTEPTYAQNVTDALGSLLGHLGMGKYAARQNAEGLVGLGQWTPLGALPAMDEAQRNYKAGNYAGAAMSAIGAVPVLGGEGRAAKGAVEEALHGLPRFKGDLKESFPVTPVEGLFPDIPAGHPDVPQFDLERNVPARGVSARVQDLVNNPDVRAQMKEMIQRGLDQGAAKWYNTEGIRQAFVNEMGDKEGNDLYRRYMGYVAATSQGSKVPMNARNASYYYGRDLQELQNGPYALKKDFGDQSFAPESPYGHKHQQGHMENINKFLANEGYDPKVNPKIAAFMENLAGNWTPATVDKHAMRLPAILSKDPRFLLTQEADALAGQAKRRPRDLVNSGQMSMEDAAKIPGFWEDQPTPANEYGAMEQYYKSLAHEMGITPAEAQAAAWVGGGHITGLGSPGAPFQDVLSDRIRRTAIQRNIPPQQVLKEFIRGQNPLLSLVAGGGLSAAMLDQLNKGNANGGS